MRCSPLRRASRRRSTRSSRTACVRSSSTSNSVPTTRSPGRSRGDRSKTKAIMMAHTLGNPFDLDDVRRPLQGARSVAHRRLLRRARLDVRRSAHRQLRRHRHRVSFYPAHHITTGEGGAVFIKSPLVRKQVESFRDWGRDCYCETGRRQHLSQALRVAARRPAARLRPQVHLQPHRVQPQGHRHAGRTRPLAAGQARRLRRRRARTTSRYLSSELAGHRGPDPAGGHPEVRPVVVRLPDHARPRAPGRPQRADAVPRRAQDRDPPACSPATSRSSRPTATSTSASSATSRTPTSS